MIDAFAESYARGETPIPCVACNQRVKFADLLEIARDSAPMRSPPAIMSPRARCAAGGRRYRAVDDERDQSYFLFATTRAQLDFLRFPLGDMAKAEVRALARRFGLPVAEKPDSQDICFVPRRQLCRRRREAAARRGRPGDIVDLDGRVLGRHDGVIHFTVGQRSGLGIAGRRAAVCGQARGRAAARRGRAARGAAHHAGIRCASVNWLGDGAVDDSPAAGATSREGAFDAPAGSGALVVDGGAAGRTGRWRGWRVAGPGLRVLRFGQRPGAGSRRRLHPFRGIARRD